MGVNKLKRHGQESGFFDALGISTGNPSIGNITLYEGFIMKAPEGCAPHAPIFNKLHAYIGVKARALDALVDINNEFYCKVAKGDALFCEELHVLAKERDIFKDAYSRVKIDKEDPEFETYVGSLGQILNS